MRRSAFDEKSTVGAAHDLMRFLHWPLTLLALLGAGVVLVKRLHPLSLPSRTADGLLPAAMAFAALFLALAAIDWLPRYTVPLRPLSYLLVAAALLWIHGVFGRRREAGRR